MERLLFNAHVVKNYAGQIYTISFRLTGKCHIWFCYTFSNEYNKHTLVALKHNLKKGETRRQKKPQVTTLSELLLRMSDVYVHTHTHAVSTCASAQSIKEAVFCIIQWPLTGTIKFFLFYVECLQKFTCPFTFATNPCIMEYRLSRVGFAIRFNKVCSDTFSLNCSFMQSLMRLPICPT